MPPSRRKTTAMPNVRTFRGLWSIVRRLRGPGGCPWDRAQTHATLKTFLLEEAYEALQALDEGDPAKLREELGDLLMQVLLHSQIASEAGEFELADVFESIGTKLVRRHPHVFGDAQAETPEEVVVNWEAIKREERGDGRSLLADVPIALPALAQARALQDKAASVGFEWRELDQVIDKLHEEVAELAREEDPQRRLEEFGDVLFVLTAAARRLRVDPEEALRLAASRFRRRFTALEAMARDLKRELTELSLEEMLALWEQAKAATTP